MAPGAEPTGSSTASMRTPAPCTHSTSITAPAATTARKPDRIMARPPLWGPLGPGRAVPGPGVVQRTALILAAEQDDGAGRRVVGHRRRIPGGRAGRRGLRRPVRPVPSPGVAQRGGMEVGAAEQDDRAG